MQNVVVRRDLNCLTIRDNTCKRAVKFYNKLYDLNNPIITEIPQCNHPLAKNRKRPRYTLDLT